MKALEDIKLEELVPERELPQVRIERIDGALGFEYQVDVTPTLILPVDGELPAISNRTFETRRLVLMQRGTSGPRFYKRVL